MTNFQAGVIITLLISILGYLIGSDVGHLLAVVVPLR